MNSKITDKKKVIGEPLADGEYTYAPNTFPSIWHITPEQKEWVDKRNKAIGIFNTTGDKRLIEELGISLEDKSM